MSKQIDFTKPLEIVGFTTGNLYDQYEVVQVIFHEYTNSLFKHGVVIRNKTDLWLAASDCYGNFSGSEPVLFLQKFRLQNKKELTSETWVNLYKSGNTSSNLYKNKAAADILETKDFGEIDLRFGYFVTKHFSDGTTTNEVIPITK